MSTALSHLPPEWPAPGPEVPEALAVSDSPSYAEMLEAAWQWAILDGLLGEMDLPFWGGDEPEGADFERANYGS